MVLIYVAIITGRRAVDCLYASTEREEVAAFCVNYNYLHTGPRAKVEVSRYRLPAAKGGVS